MNLKFYILELENHNSKLKKSLRKVKAIQIRKALILIVYYIKKYVNYWSSIVFKKCIIYTENIEC